MILFEQESEAELREYVLSQLASDPKYIPTTVSKNAAVNFKQEGSLNELIADALLQIDKQVEKDPTLLKLVGGIFYDA